jgi:hypothetical protein
MTLPRHILIKNRILALWKWSLSFRKHDWELSDYPVVVRQQESNLTHTTTRFKQHRYLAYIVNWAVAGVGDTPEEAVDALGQNLGTIKRNWINEGRPLVRPGTLGPVEFASQERIAVNHELSEDFIRRVLDLDWAWISDESTLWDFHSDETNELLSNKVKQVYGVDVSDIESAKLSEILDRIATTRHEQMQP